MILPTTANTPPRIADLVADDKAFTGANLLALRNCSLINVIDGCAISLPAHREGEVPSVDAGGYRRGRPPHLRTGGSEWKGSSVFDLAFTIDAQGTTTPLTLAIDQAVISAGWTGRDPVARDKHIAELEAIGIARPATTPIYYRVAALADHHR